MVVSTIFFVHPYLGKIPILTNIFQMGSNHQLVLIYQLIFGQNIATSHGLGPQKVAKEGKSPYFREIQVGEIL